MTLGVHVAQYLVCCVMSFQLLFVILFFDNFIVCTSSIHVFRSIRIFKNCLNQSASILTLFLALINNIL
jgi:hypothetical protein